MKLNAKVSIKSVNTFKQKAINIQELSKLFDSGKTYISEINKIVKDKISALDQVQPDLNAALDDIQNKIDALDKQLIEWEKKHEAVHGELEEKENELDSVDRTIVYTDSDGNEHETINPEYSAIKNDISNIKAELTSIENEIDTIQKKINDAEQIERKIDTHIEKIEDTIRDLEKLKKESERFEGEIEEAKQENNRICSKAVDLLNKIEKIIDAYLQVKNSTSQIQEAMKIHAFPVSYVDEFHLDISPIMIFNTAKTPSDIENEIDDKEELPDDLDDNEDYSDDTDNDEIVDEEDEDIEENEEYDEEDEEYDDGDEQIEENDSLNYDAKEKDEQSEIFEEDELKGKKYEDDNGNVYRIGNCLAPNITYVVNGYSYKTDDKGRIVSASGKLRMRDKNYDREMETVRKIDGQEYREDDDRGHLIAHQFGGSDKLENLVPMNRTLNQIDYKKVEDTLASAVQDGADVRLEVKPIYENDSARPTEFVISYSIDDDKTIVIFKNEESQEDEQ